MSQSTRHPKPNFFIVGAPKCGTTAMYEYLKQHPDIFMPEVKEPRFFGARPEARRFKTEQDYLQLFKGVRQEKRIGEASPSYLRAPRAAAEIQAFCPDAQIIVMLRSPVDLIYSAFFQSKASGTEEQETLEEALARSGSAETLRDGKTPRPNYLSYARFVEPLQRYFDTFGRENVHVIIFDDLKENTPEVYRKTLEFLEVDPGFQPEFNVVNAAKQVRSPALQRVLVALGLTPMQVKYSRLGRAAAIIPAPLRERALKALRAAYTIEKRPPPMDAELRHQLQQTFLPEVEQLSALLGRDLTHWCRDEP